MDKILVVGAGTFQLPLVEKASRDHEVIIAAPEIDERFERLISGKLITDVRNKEEILDYARKNDAAGITTDQTDMTVKTAAYVAENLGLPGIGYETGCLFTDKALMRKGMQELGIKVLPNKVVSAEEEAVAFFRKLDSPVIIKPSDSQGSRGVAKCASDEDVRDNFEHALSYSSRGEVVIEKFATGREFVVEGIALDNEFRNLCIGDTEYFDIKDAFAAKTRIFPTNAEESLRERVLDLNARIISGFGLRQGITHSEFIMDGEDIYLIETAARGGGVFISSDLISIMTGLDTEKFLIDIATRDIQRMPDTTEKDVSCGYIAFYIPNGTVTKVEGVDKIRTLDYVHRNQLDELYVGKKVCGGQTDKTTRLAITVSAPTREKLLDRMEIIKKTVKATVDNNGVESGLIWE